jgi:hypothetical protein
LRRLRSTNYWRARDDVGERATALSAARSTWSGARRHACPNGQSPSANAKLDTTPTLQRRAQTACALKPYGATRENPIMGQRRTPTAAFARDLGIAWAMLGFRYFQG